MHESPPRGKPPADEPPVADEPPPRTPDPYGILGEPFATYARLLAAFAAADQRRHAAQIAGDPVERELAEAEYEERHAAASAYRQHGAAALLLLARFAAECHPGALASHLDPAYRRELDATQHALREALADLHDLRARVAELEEVTACLACGEAVMV